MKTDTLARQDSNHAHALSIIPRITALAASWWHWLLFMFMGSASILRHGALQNEVLQSATVEISSARTGQMQPGTSGIPKWERAVQRAVGSSHN